MGEQMEFPSRLLGEARSILDQAADRPVDETIDSIERYSERFTDWFERNRAAIEQGAMQSPELSELLSLHERIVDLVSRLMNDTSSRRSELKRRGKGILSYLDTLPRRLSVTGMKKG